MFPNMLSLVDLILSIPASSAEVERGFSQLKLIKSANRSKMSQKSLNDNLAIKLSLGSDEEFDPDPAIEHWLGCGKRPRRPLLKDGPTGRSTGVKTDKQRPVEVEETDDANSDYDSDISVDEGTAYNLMLEI